MALPPSTANWHWKNKNVTRWGREWFERELITISIAESDGQVVSISEVEDVDGDIELGQRKSKYVCSRYNHQFSPKHVVRLITIYDCKMDLAWSGKASDGTEVKGKLSIPEVSHEITLDGLSEYVVSRLSPF